MTTSKEASWIYQIFNSEYVIRIVITLAALLGLVCANPRVSETYFALLESELSIDFGENSISQNLHHWINDGLKAIFFFVVSLEVKREQIDGELNIFEKAVHPLVAALGGMIVPAVIYLLFNWNSDQDSG